VLHKADLVKAWRDLDSGAAGSAGQAGKVELVAIGNPHLSLEECAKVAALCEEAPGDRVASGVSLVATMGREVHAEAQEAGHVGRMEAFGVKFVTDTCWCMLTEPVVPVDSTSLLTNRSAHSPTTGQFRNFPPNSPPPLSLSALGTCSAKYAHYAPGLVNRQVRYRSLEACVKAARTGNLPPPPWWLLANGRGYSTGRVAAAAKSFGGAGRRSFSSRPLVSAALRAVRFVR